MNKKTLEKNTEKNEELQAFFKIIYNAKEKKWFLLDFDAENISEIDEEKKYQN